MNNKTVLDLFNTQCEKQNFLNYGTFNSLEPVAKNTAFVTSSFFHVYPILNISAENEYHTKTVYLTCKTGSFEKHTGNGKFKSLNTTISQFSNCQLSISDIIEFWRSFFQELNIEITSVKIPTLKQYWEDYLSFTTINFSANLSFSYEQDSETYSFNTIEFYSGDWFLGSISVINSNIMASEFFVDNIVGCFNNLKFENREESKVLLIEELKQFSDKHEQTSNYIEYLSDLK